MAKATAYQQPFNWDFLAAAGSLVLYADIIAFLLMLALRRRLTSSSSTCRPCANWRCRS